MSTAEQAETVSLSPQQEHGAVPAPMVIRPQTLAEYMELAKMLADSDIVPRDYKGKPGNVLVAMQMGAEIGLHPIQAIQSIAVINGRPSVWGDAGLGIVMASGKLESVDETDDPVTLTATCTLKRKGHDKLFIRMFSHKDAETAKVYESDGRGGGSWKPLADRGPWRSYPKRMRQMRARWWALRDGFPDVLKGLAGREEVEDQGEEVRVGAEAAKRVEGEVIASSMMPKRASETRVTTQEADGARGDTEQDGRQQGPGSTVDRPEPQGVAAPPVADADASEPATPKERPKVGDEPTPGSPTQPPLLPGTMLAEPIPATPIPEKDSPKLRFMIGKQPFETAGVTKSQLLTIFTLCGKVDRLHGRNYSVDEVLKKEFHVEHRTELDEEHAGRYVIRLQEILEPEG